MSAIKVGGTKTELKRMLHARALLIINVFFFKHDLENWYRGVLILNNYNQNVTVSDKGITENFHEVRGTSNIR